MELYQQNLQWSPQEGVDTPAETNEYLLIATGIFTESVCAAIDAREHELLTIVDILRHDAFYRIVTSSIRGRISYAITPAPFVNVWVGGDLGGSPLQAQTVELTIHGRADKGQQMKIYLKDFWIFLHDYYTLDFSQQLENLVDVILPFEIGRAPTASAGEKAYRLKQVKKMHTDFNLREQVATWTAQYEKEMNGIQCAHCYNRQKFIDEVKERYTGLMCQKWYEFGRKIFRKYENVSVINLRRIVQIP